MIASIKLQFFGKNLLLNRILLFPRQNSPMVLVILLFAFLEKENSKTGITHKMGKR